MTNSLHTDVRNIVKKYHEKLKENMDRKNTEYNDLLNHMTESKKMREEMEKIESDLSSIGLNVTHINSVKGGIENVIN
ncbi:MAG: hypothetical protein LBG96_07135 [Tannerella sp.]|jgi:hypothetical protein|nr:hypothetical protein [Tannerella sp.]